MLHDWQASKVIIAAFLYCTGILLLRLNMGAKGTALLARTHRAGLSFFFDGRIEGIFREALSGSNGRIPARVSAAINDFPNSRHYSANARRIVDSPTSLFDGHAIVLKSASALERGVIYLFYSYTYPIFLSLYRAEEISKKYRIVLEPSWSGFCDLNILCMRRLGQRVIVGCGESRDARFLRAIDGPFVPGEFTGNTWIDVETFKPNLAVAKDIDLVVVAAWAWYKRHWAIFRVLRTLREKGTVLRVALVGYPGDMSLHDIKRLASHYGVHDQIEYHERVSTEDVSRVFNRSRVNLLWSRREGTPRTLPEGMAAGVPGIARRGFNYGDAQPYISSKSGIYSDEASLETDLVAMSSGWRMYSPRDWVAAQMTPEASTARLNRQLKELAIQEGESWTTDIVAKVSALDGLRYANPSDASRFEADYSFLRASLRC